MQLWKAHGLGNDYLVWEGRANTLNEGQVRKICHRSKGVGGDGILEPTKSMCADFGVRIWNPDGSVAEKSGNGLRIFAHWLHYEKGAPHSFSIDTGFCIVHAHILETEISIEMGRAYWKPEEIPCTTPIWKTRHTIAEHVLTLYAVGVGNPHCVALFDSDQCFDDLDWVTWGAILEHDRRFPNRTNVQFAKVLNRNTIEMRIFERGAGETSASGSSSCAVASVCHRLGLVDAQIELHMPGGILKVSIDESGEVLLLGPVQVVGRCRLEQGFLFG